MKYYQRHNQTIEDNYNILMDMHGAAGVSVHTIIFDKAAALLTVDVEPSLNGATIKYLSSRLKLEVAQVDEILTTMAGLNYIDAKKWEDKIIFIPLLYSIGDEYLKKTTNLRKKKYPDSVGTVSGHASSINTINSKELDSSILINNNNTKSISKAKNKKSKKTIETLELERWELLFQEKYKNNHKIEFLFSSDFALNRKKIKEIMVALSNDYDLYEACLDAMFRHSWLKGKATPQKMKQNINELKTIAMKKRSLGDNSNKGNLSEKDWLGEIDG